jgi:hypothetical protein
MQTLPTAQVSPPLNLRVGQLVEIRSAAEILDTLDDRGEFNGLPFMPEMLRLCGQQFTVAAVAHKGCDTIGRSGMYKMDDAVHLTGAGSRCDGSAHGGCQAACVFYWKTAWLKRVDAPVNGVVPDPSAAEDAPRLLPLLVRNSRKERAEDGTERYSCQATEMPRAAPVVQKLLDPKQYALDIRSGNRPAPWVLRSFLVGLFNRMQGLSRMHLPRWMQFRHGMSWRFIQGSAGSTTATEITNLQAGELVRIKSRDEIMKTLNKDQLNRGLGFDAEMSRFCGKTARVARRVTNIVDEHTGKMLTMKNPCIVLEGVVCEGAYNMSCMRAIPCYWREIWLERIEA